jgi:hypothetical protein
MASRISRGLWRPPTGLGSGKMGLQGTPLGVGEVALICFSHARYPTERVPQNPFSDGFIANFTESPECELRLNGVL